MIRQTPRHLPHSPLSEDPLKPLTEKEREIEWGLVIEEVRKALAPWVLEQIKSMHFSAVSDSPTSWARLVSNALADAKRVQENTLRAKYEEGYRYGLEQGRAAADREWREGLEKVLDDQRRA